MTGEHRKTASKAPVAKVTAATAAGAAVYIAALIAKQFDIEVDDDLTDAVTVLAVFLGGYLKRP